MSMSLRRAIVYVDCSPHGCPPATMNCILSLLSNFLRNLSFCYSNFIVPRTRQKSEAIYNLLLRLALARSRGFLQARQSPVCGILRSGRFFIGWLAGQHLFAWASIILHRVDLARGRAVNESSG